MTQKGKNNICQFTENNVRKKLKRLCPESLQQDSTEATAATVKVNEVYDFQS